MTGSETLCLPSASANSASVLRSSGHEADADIGAHRIGRRGDDDRLAVDAQVSRRRCRSCRNRRETGRAVPCPAGRRRRGFRRPAARTRRRGACRRSRCVRRASTSAPSSRPVCAPRRKGVRKRAADDHSDDLVVGISRRRGRSRYAGRCAAPSSCRRRPAPRAGDAR